MLLPFHYLVYRLITSGHWACKQNNRNAAFVFVQEELMADAYEFIEVWHQIRFLRMNVFLDYAL